MKTPGVKSPFTSEKREAGAALLSEGPVGSAFPLHAVQAGLGEEGPQKGWEDFLTRQCEYTVEIRSSSSYSCPSLHLENS